MISQPKLVFQIARIKENTFGKILTCLLKRLKILLSLNNYQKKRICNKICDCNVWNTRHLAVVFLLVIINT